MIRLVVAQSHQRGEWWVDRNNALFLDPAGRYRKPRIVCTPHEVGCRGLRLHRNEIALLDDLDPQVLPMVESLMWPGERLDLLPVRMNVSTPISKAAEKKLLSNLITLRRKLNTKDS